MSFICQRCSVYIDDPKQTVFATADDAEKHVLEKHATRLLDMYQGVMKGFPDGVREGNLHFMLRNHNAR